MISPSREIRTTESTLVVVEKIAYASPAKVAMGKPPASGMRIPFRSSSLPPAVKRAA
jgi:hypothetical protein